MLLRREGLARRAGTPLDVNFLQCSKRLNSEDGFKGDAAPADTPAGETDPTPIEEILSGAVTALTPYTTGNR